MVDESPSHYIDIVREFWTSDQPAASKCLPASLQQMLRGLHQWGKSIGDQFSNALTTLFSNLSHAVDKENQHRESEIWLQILQVLKDHSGFNGRGLKENKIHLFFHR